MLVQAQIERSTEKAIMVNISYNHLPSENKNLWKGVWFPKSQVKEAGNEKMEVADWLLNKLATEIKAKTNMSSIFGAEQIFSI